MLRFKDTIKDILKRGEVLGSWTKSVENRPEWRKLTFEVCNGINKKRIENNERTREKGHQIDKNYGSLLELLCCVL